MFFFFFFLGHMVLSLAITTNVAHDPFDETIENDPTKNSVPSYWVAGFVGLDLVGPIEKMVNQFHFYLNMKYPKSIEF